MMNKETDVILSILKLSRAMRRCPPDHRENPFPPAVGRLLECVSEHSGVSSRELCEILDLRPSSLSEMLARAESEGLIIRTVDEEDRRVQRVRLSDRGLRIVSDMQSARVEDAKKKTSCLTDEEKEQFCALSDKLSAHLESLASDVPDFMRRPPCPPRRPPCGPRPEGPGFPEPPFPEPPAFPQPDDRKNEKPDGKPNLPPGGRVRC